MQILMRKGDHHTEKNDENSVCRSAVLQPHRNSYFMEQILRALAQQAPSGLCEQVICTFVNTFTYPCWFGGFGFFFLLITLLSQTFSWAQETQPSTTFFYIH